MILNVYLSNNRTSLYIKQKLTELKGRTEEAIIRVGNFNMLLLVIVIISRLPPVIIN